MAIEYSTALRNFLQNHGSKKQALEGGVFEIFSGAAPASPNDAASGTRLLRVTLASGGLTAEVLSEGTITLTGTSGTCTNVTVDSVSILDSTVTFDTDLTTTATALALAINASKHTRERYFAFSSGAVVTVQALPGTGTTPNGFILDSTMVGGDLAGADVNLGTAAAGVANVNGLTFSGSVTGALSKAGVWSGVVLATGTAGYFRMTGSVADDWLVDAAPWTRIRLQGTCGTSGADYNMNTTSLTQSATHTMDSWVETLNEA
jgi:hypothetical protein